MSQRYASLRVQMLAVVRRHANEAYPPELRRQATVAVVEMRAAGMSWRVIGDAIGISSNSAQKWWRQQNGDERALVPVRVVGRSRGPGKRLTMVSPGGFRVEGAELDDILLLLRGLG